MDTKTKCFLELEDEDGTTQVQPRVQGRGGEVDAGSRGIGGLLREGLDMRFAFIAKHRGIWPIAWICEALGVSRSGFHAWLVRAPSARSRSDAGLAAKVRASFIYSYRTYGARRVWHDLLAKAL